MVYPNLKHPSQFTWDFWYYFEKKSNLFHLFYLNAGSALVPAEQHHWAAQVGYATTSDFLSVKWGSTAVLTASRRRWDNSSIWTGDVVRIQNGFLMFYTSRNLGTDDGKTQNIGIAFADRINTPRWRALPDIRIPPDGLIYSPRHIPGDISIHAWRDPYVFRHENQIYMLVTAKSLRQAPGRNGVVALLRSQDGGYKNWEYLPAVADPGCYSEMEVTQILRRLDGKFELFFSTGPDYDQTPGYEHSGGLYGIISENPFNFREKPRLLYPFQDGLYACRIIPEMDGEIVGFDHRIGGLRRSGIKTHLLEMDRDFPEWKF
ncbi:MAG TPA: beta-fructosidase [Candidatus Marinimicrobia bacterium]|nr:beta-fructosidase [Candidatus Neomarinimicrobiota bacterium]